MIIPAPLIIQNIQQVITSYVAHGSLTIKRTIYHGLFTSTWDLTVVAIEEGYDGRDVCE